jgi:DNA-binding transcriptional ArsR family regulator
MSDLDKDTLEDLADIYQALGNKTRLHTLQKLSQDRPVSELTDELGITRSGLQKNIERLIQSELVYRPQEEDSKTYALTPLGDRYVELLKEDSKHALTVLNQLNKQLQDLEEEQSETRETLEEAGVDLTEYEQKLKEEAWKNIWDEAEENL